MKFRISFVIIVSNFFLQSYGYAAGENAFSFLLIAPGARSGAMGESVSGLDDGIESMNVNPSGILNENRPQLSFQHLSYVEGILYHHVSYLHPTLKGGWGIQLGYLGVAGLTKTVADASLPDGFREMGEFSTYDLQAGFSIARKVTDQFGVGVTSRFLRESLSDAAAQGVSFDAGLFYRDAVLPILLGLSVQHIGPKVKFKDEEFRLPQLVRGGISISNPVNSSLRWIPTHSLFTAEVLRYLSGEDSSVRSGIEIPFFHETIFCRVGYNYLFKKQTLGNSMTLPSGISFGTGVQWTSFQLDYALSSLGELGVNHRISVTLKLGYLNG